GRIRRWNGRRYARARSTPTTSTSAPASSSAVARLPTQRPRQLPAQHARTPVFLDVLHHQFRALLVRHVRAGLRIVHAVGQITNQHAADTPFRHLPDGECPLEYADIRVHSHHEQVADTLLFQQAVNLRALIRDDVLAGDSNSGMLPAPGLVEFV